MHEWLTQHGWEKFEGHGEGSVFSTPALYLAIYNGDGVWHLFDRAEAASYDFNTARGRGVGLGSLLVALATTASSPRPSE